MSTTTVELTPEIRARRVAVCRDMAAQIVAKEMTIAHGGYLSILDDNDDDFLRFIEDLLAANAEVELQPHIKRVAGACSVCLRGGLLLAKAHLYDAVPLNALFLSSGYATLSSEENATLLLDTFDRMTLAMLEAAFERTARFAWMTIDASSDDFPFIYGAALFGYELGIADPAERALAILKVVIEADGEFIVASRSGEEYQEMSNKVYDETH